MNANDSRALEVLQYQEAMKRDNWETHWQEIAELILPRYAEFTGNRAPGEKRTERIYDGSPQSALRMFAAALDSMLTPRTQKWHALKAQPAALNQNRDVKMYLEQVTDALFAARLAPQANFHSQLAESYMMLGAFGTQGLYIEDGIDRGIRYQAVPLAELYFTDDAFGRPVRVHRKYKLTAAAAVREFGVDVVPEKIKQALEKDPQHLFEFVHCVKLNELYDPGRIDSRAMRLASLHVSAEGRVVVREKGYRTMPYCISRYYKGPGEQYGRGPGMEVLPDIKMLNEMEKTIIRAAHKAVDPPLLLADDGVLQPFATTPGALNWGGINAAGQQLVQPLVTGARLDQGAEIMEYKRKVIDGAFLVTLFQILVETPRMTATEVLERAQEKGILLAPMVGRQQSELLGPMIERELDILASRPGALPEMPDILAEYGGDYEVEYDTPITRALKAEGASGILRMVETITPFATIDPRVMRRFNADEALKVIAEATGVPASVLRSDDELEAMDEAEAQKEQMANLLEAAPIAASAAKDMAQAEQMAGAGLSRMLPGQV